MTGGVGEKVVLTEPGVKEMIADGRLWSKIKKCVPPRGGHCALARAQRVGAGVTVVRAVHTGTSARTRSSAAR
jgi:hypothetical protein